MLLLFHFWVVEPPEVLPEEPVTSYALELLVAPPVPKPVAKAMPKPVAKPSPKPAAAKALPKPKSAPKASKPVIDEQAQAQARAAAAARRQAAAKAAAANAGVMAFSAQLAQMRDTSSDVVISEKNLRDRGAVRSEQAETSSDTLSASKTSAGRGDIGQRSVSGEQSSTAVGGHSTEKLAAISSRSAATGGGGSAGNAKPSRSLEEIQLAFDRSKNAFYAIFNRAARKDSSIRAGTVVVSLTIQPDGSVSNCKIVSSSFFNADLKEKLLQRVSMLKFEAKAVPAFTYPNYPISYVP